MIWRRHAPCVLVKFQNHGRFDLQDERSKDDLTLPLPSFFFLGLRSNSAVDMRQLTNALVEAREGTGEVRSVLLSAAFRPRLPGLTKLVSKLSKEGSWRKALEVFETVEELGVRPDTALTNSAISACDKGGE